MEMTQVSMYTRMLALVILVVIFGKGPTYTSTLCETAVGHQTGRQDRSTRNTILLQHGSEQTVCSIMTTVSLLVS
jgi:hypothetical protein